MEQLFEKVFTQTIRRFQQERGVSLSHTCRLFGISRQSIYKKEKRIVFRNQELKQVKSAVMEIRMQMPKIGTRKLYYLLSDKFSEMSVKIGRDALFDYLRSENMLVKPRKIIQKQLTRNIG